MSDPQTAIQTPTQLLKEVIAILLIPLFLETASGDLSLARAAAHQLLASHNARSPLELLFTAQAFAFGMAALGAINQPMPENATPSLALRIRTNANALNRSAERCWNAVERSLQNCWLPLPPEAVEEAERAVETAPDAQLPSAPVEAEAEPTLLEPIADPLIPIPPWERWEHGLRIFAQAAERLSQGTEDQPAPFDSDTET
jgi:hypothetical protein